jgi:hypothetical protein
MSSFFLRTVELGDLARRDYHLGFAGRRPHVCIESERTDWLQRYDFKRTDPSLLLVFNHIIEPGTNGLVDIMLTLLSRDTKISSMMVQALSLSSSYQVQMLRHSQESLLVTAHIDM